MFGDESGGLVVFQLVCVSMLLVVFLCMFEIHFVMGFWWSFLMLVICLFVCCLGGQIHVAHSFLGLQSMLLMQSEGSLETNMISTQY